MLKKFHGLASVAAALALAAAIAGCQAQAKAPAAQAGAPAAPAGKAQTIEIKATEFKFEPKDATVKAGENTFEVKNTGTTDHNIVIQDASKKDLAQIPVVAVGKSEQLKVDLKPGTYTIVCSFPGHKDGGMVGTLKVE